MLCNVLGVTISELFDDKKTIPCISSEIAGQELQYITQEEKELIEYYQKFSAKKKKLLKIYIDMLYQYDDKLLVEKIDKKI